VQQDQALVVAAIHAENERDFSHENTRRPLEGLVSAAGPMPWLYAFELTQNALDAGAKRVRIRILDGAVVFEHDGTQPLEEAHVRALSAANRSTKGWNSVGFMGVGFKSVFQRLV